ncbi:transposase [Micromonospora chersina]|uniref:transposase n=1 Tax=Micromonospora chersina TaxID=47854 RepID=UPI00371AF9E6
MATDLEAVNDRITAIEETIAAVVAEHELGEIVTSLPGIGTTLAAEFLAHAGTLTTYPGPAALAAHAGLAPISGTPAAAKATRSDPTATTAACAGCSACPASPP